jgi:hypothetical protein
MAAPQRFAEWMSTYRHVDRSDRHNPVDTPYRYHPRSNATSIRLGEYIADDLYNASENLRARVARGQAAYSVDQPFLWGAADEERIDLAIGIPNGLPVPVETTSIPRSGDLGRLFVALEAKAAMTKHIGAKPRLRRELISAHVLTHERDQQAIAAGITIVNVSPTFVAAGAQRDDGSWPLVKRTHNMPNDALSLMDYLRRMRIRDSLNETGFDAYCHVVIATDNIEGCELITTPPAPQVGDPDHYDTFLARLVVLFDRRFP